MTSRRTNLRAVSDSEPAPKPKPPKKLTAAVDGSERGLLVAMRAMAAADLDSGKVPAHARPTMMKHLRELDKEIRAIDARDAENGSDDAPGPVADDTFDASAI